ncbi:hypothetical protein AGMMS4952_00570 [Spirochaetia bacterium]|nr:hypothetical protein AGMMS4952_00570 [Spirochaetia bacterium]
MTIEFNQSAFDHHIPKEDILCAMSMVLFDGLMSKYANKYLLIGFDRNSNLLEVMYNIRKDGSYNVFHAMKCRKDYYHYVEENNGYV